MERELATLVEAIRNAGTKVRELVRVGFEVQTKSDHSPVTTVDHEVNRILHEMQRREFPQDGWLSEESPTIRLDSPTGVSGLWTPSTVPRPW